MLYSIIDHIQILEIFRHPENRIVKMRSRSNYIIDFCDNDKDLEDSEFALKYQNRLSNSKKFKNLYRRDKDKHIWSFLNQKY